MNGYTICAQCGTAVLVAVTFDLGAGWRCLDCIVANLEGRDR